MTTTTTHVTAGQHACVKPQTSTCPPDLEWVENSWRCSTCGQAWEFYVHRGKVQRNTWTTVGGPSLIWRFKRNRALRKQVSA